MWITVGSYYDDDDDFVVFVYTYDTETEAKQKIDELLEEYEEKDRRYHSVDIKNIVNGQYKLIHDFDYKTISVKQIE